MIYINRKKEFTEWKWFLHGNNYLIYIIIKDTLWKMFFAK
jgi:hypothetical protein